MSISLSLSPPPSPPRSPISPTSNSILQKQARKILDPDDFSSLVSFLQNLPTSQLILGYLTRHYLNSLSLRLAQLLHCRPPVAIRDLAFDLLNRLLTLSEHHLWPCIPLLVRNQLKPIFLDILRKEHSVSFLPRLRDLVDGIASDFVPNNEWPELVEYIIGSIESNSEIVRESALLLFADLTYGVFAEHFDGVADQLRDSIMKTLVNEKYAVKVRVAAVMASVKSILYMKTPSQQSQCQDLLLAVCPVVFMIVNKGPDSCAEQVLGAMIELAGQRPDVLNDSIEMVLESMLLAAENKRLQKQTRFLAMEFVVTIAEVKDELLDMIVKLPRVVKRILCHLLRTLVMIDEDPSMNVLKKDNPNPGSKTSSLYFCGTEHLGRYAATLGGVIVGNFPDLFMQNLVSVDWKSRQASVTFLTIIVKSCSKVLKENLKRVMDTMKDVERDSHPRVRLAVINAFREFSEHLKPEFQHQYHHEVVPALEASMNDFENPSNQAKAVLAICYFSIGCSSASLLKPYLNVIVSRLLSILQKGNKILQHCVLKALGTLAILSKEQFQEYYDTVMPYLKLSLMSATDRSDHVLLARSLDCITMVWTTAGKEKFSDDILMVVKALLVLEESGSEIGPMRNNILVAWGRLCKCLGQDFLPYLSVAVPQLLKAVQHTDPISSGCEADEDLDESPVASIKSISLGEEVIDVKTNVRNEKVIACNILSSCAAELKESFYMWVDEVTMTLVPFLKFNLQEVRIAATSAMPILLLSCKSSIEKGYFQGFNESPLQRLSVYVIPALQEALHEEKVSEIRARILYALDECIEISGPLLNETQLNCLADEIIQILTTSSVEDKTEQVIESVPDNSYSESEEKLFVEDNRQQKEVTKKAGDCLASIVKTYKETISTLFDKLLSCIAMMWSLDKNVEERRIALEIFCNVLEQCRGLALLHYKSSIPLLFKACNVENPEVQQVAACGIGYCAKFGGIHFISLIGEAVTGLKHVMRHPNAQRRDYVMAHDEAVSALGKIIQFHSYHSSISEGEVVSIWLSHLPIKNDLNQAKVVHGSLCTMLERSESILVGPEKANLSKIILILAEILWAGNNLASAETVSQVIRILKNFQQKVPTLSWKSAQSSLQPYHQNLLRCGIFAGKGESSDDVAMDRPAHLVTNKEAQLANIEPKIKSPDDNPEPEPNLASITSPAFSLSSFWSTHLNSSTPRKRKVTSDPSPALGSTKKLKTDDDNTSSSQ